MLALSRRDVAAGLFGLLAMPRVGLAAALALRTYDLGRGVKLHGVEHGSGPLVIFVHGSLSDFDYWSSEVAAFGSTHRAIAYSRRYNWPNHNKAIAGYSAIVDALDLARLIERLNSGPAHLVGHSYGALTALFLAIRRPQLVRSLSLAEPPAVSLLDHLPGELAARGRAMRADIREHMEEPMRAAFIAGDRERGVAAFIDYVLGPGAWAKMKPSAREETMRSAAEWDVMLTKGTLFPEVPRAAVQRVLAPTLLLSGAKSYPFLALTDGELARLIPRAHRLVVPNATHQMWLQAPETCRRATLENQTRGSLG
jgi:pimeloyl-ACP methyl ester carboxylesterase